MISHSPEQNHQYNPDENEILTWEDSFAIAQYLRANHPEVNLEDVSIDKIFLWSIELPNFNDDPELVNDSILMAIYQEWLEEVFSA